MQRRSRYLALPEVSDIKEDKTTITSCRCVRGNRMTDTLLKREKESQKTPLHAHIVLNPLPSLVCHPHNFLLCVCKPSCRRVLVIMSLYVNLHPSQARAVFSGSATRFLVSLITASCPPIRRPSALSSFAPKANLLRFSLRSWLSTNLWLASFLSSSFSRPSSMSLISCWAESEVRDVLTVLATEGAAL